MKINLQEPRKQELREDGVLSVHSIFHTIQGEGPFNGVPAVFVRLADCNLQCPGCDTEYTSVRQLMSPPELCRAVRDVAGPRSKTKLIVLTGGEPFRQNFAAFARMITYSGWHVQVETNGTLWFDEFFPSRFSVVCSPKAPSINSQLLRYVTALKYVLKATEIDPDDGLPLSILENGLRPCRPWPGFRGDVFVQPYDEYQDSAHQDPTGNAQRVNSDNTKATVDVCMRYGYRLCLQTHKIVGLP